MSRIRSHASGKSLEPYGSMSNSMVGEITPPNGNDVEQSRHDNSEEIPVTTLTETEDEHAEVRNKH